jgi:hypothetical protein
MHNTHFGAVGTGVLGVISTPFLFLGMNIQALITIFEVNRVYFISISSK